MDVTTITKKFAILVLVMLAFQSCDNDVIEPDVAGNYFALRDAHEWRYERWLDDRWLFDTLALRVDGTIAIDGNTYTRIVKQSGELDKLVWVEGSQYFGRHHELYGTFSHEYVFLDTDKAVGETWSYIKDNGRSKTEYRILAKNAEHTVNGNIYDNVIEVEIKYYLLESDVFTHWVTALHYYAKDVGEIYHYYPYPVSGVYGGIDAFIIGK